MEKPLLPPRSNINSKAICVDLDGVLHDYDGNFGDGLLHGEPIEGAVEGMWLLKEHGYNIVVCTVRTTFEDIEKWLKKHGFPDALVTNRKPKALAYIDDRGIRFINWKDTVRYFL